ncbi:MAG: mannose-1-phosphate guanylyltransferase [Treponema sp.]|jgi:mannose-1-phosphate guanylyltransferase/mannose-6-phosphate isomerase|nr:mannose-1-phosphate guanylyltransferase [Treponema sp.]
MFSDCIIMAGGSGTRLWPASNAAKPKQFLTYRSKDSEKNTPSGGIFYQTFFASALERGLAVLATDGRLIIIAAECYTSLVLAECARFGEEARRRMVLIPEPEAKNTAAAIACGVRYAAMDGDRCILVLTSDHIIAPLEVFKANAAVAYRTALKQDALVVFGIPPTKPETAYGYIEAAECLTGTGAIKVASFREKPDKLTAERFLEAGGFYWNSGMFAFTSGFMLGEFARLAPDVFAAFDRLPPPSASAYTTESGLRILGAWAGLAAAYHESKRVSFDYAIAERCARTFMVVADFAWRDIGSWDEYAPLAGSNGAEVYEAGAESCFVDADIPVALCGVKDLIVVVRSGKDGGASSVLVARKGETQRIREIVEQIRDAGRTELL